MKVNYISNPEDFFHALKRKKVDLIAPTHNLLKDERYKMIKNQLLLPIDLNNVPNYKNLEVKIKNIKYNKDQDKIYSIPFIYGYYGLAYNKRYIESPPQSWLSLWNSKQKKQYAISKDYYEVNIYITALSLGYRGNQIHSYDTLNNKKVHLEASSTC
ncbi:ABC transporter substrate-binding protein [Piscirickettsia litoralis]|uniref:Solute-binding protein family 3/N-terminal domain-containing protein n=1 Tax=Piscirickettsia litoralis TaxID=1891921 RepID=A0ABX3A545_9GAMM|nr:ABC transporter substrate-binding protein [Piscirickettsia litoralis]ODN43548.1 hypothetical protein BGC07_12255 [Piscirickettsia litoralis]